MFGRKKTEHKQPRKHSGNLSQYGLFDIPTVSSFDNDGAVSDEENNSDLEAELFALANDGDSQPKRPHRRAPQPGANLDAMIQASLKDIPSDEELSGDDDDPELLNELNNITEDVEVPPEDQSAVKQHTTPTDAKKLLEERLKMYELAESNSKSAGETSRARRFNRGIKTLKDLIKTVNSGRPINPEDIPPEVSVNVQKKETLSDSVKDSNVVIPTAPFIEPINKSDEHPESPPQINHKLDEPEESDAANKLIRLSDDNADLLTLLQERKEQYKLAALKAKKDGDNATAIAHVKVVKQFDVVINAVENGQPVDLSRMPGPPIDQSGSKIINDNVQTHSDSAVISNENAQANGVITQELPGDVNPLELITASSVEEALLQRLDLYKKQSETAKEQGNASKSRRMGRIVKQFEDALKLHRAGRTVPFDELPSPPGYAPIPGTKKPDITPPDPPPSIPEQREDLAPKLPPRSPSMIPTSPSTTSTTSGPSPSKPTTASVRIQTSRAEKQLQLLLMRQKEFREAALKSKQSGELEQAKEYLRTARGFEPLIQASRGGLPVDIASLPLPPAAKTNLDLEYDLVMSEECVEGDSGVLDAMSRLETQLTKQLKMCLTTRDHHKALGDVAGTNRFENLALGVTKDLDLLRLAKRTNCALPKCHYESRDFSIVKSFTDLNDNDLELCILRGINYNCMNRKDIDTYVKLEFPYPQEEPFRERTVTIKDTNNPEYQSTFILNINRTARPCLRVFKRHAIKFEVYSKGSCVPSEWTCCFSGLFRGDTLLGTVNVKLQQLETQCELHDSFDLMDGRKKVGGKLEIRLRVRHPLLTKQVEQLSEKWVVLDH